MNGPINKWSAATHKAYVAALTVVVLAIVGWNYGGHAVQAWGDGWLDRTMGGQHFSVVLADTITAPESRVIERRVQQVATEMVGLEVEQVTFLTSAEAARQFGRMVGHSLADVRLPASIEVSFAGDAVVAAKFKAAIVSCPGVREVIDDTAALQAREYFEGRIGEGSLLVGLFLGAGALVLLYGAAVGWVLTQVYLGAGGSVVARALNLGVGVGLVWAVVGVVGDAAASSVGSPWALGFAGSLWNGAWAVVGGAGAALITTVLAKWTVQN